MHSNQTTFNPYGQNAAIVKNYFKKPAILVLGILYSLSLVLTIVNTLLSSTISAESFKSFLVSLCDVMGMPEEAATLESNLSFSLSNSFSTLIAMAPSLIFSILVIVAIFKIYSSSKSTNPAASPRGGFIILFVVSLFQMIGSILATVFLLGFFILAWIFVKISLTDLSLEDVGFTELNFVPSILDILFIFTAISLIVLIIMNISKVRYTSSLKNSISSTTLSYKGAGSYGFFSILFSILDILWLAPCILLGYATIYMADTLLNIDILQIPNIVFIFFAISLLLLVITFFMEAIIAFGYKRYIKKYTKGYLKQAQPVYEQPLPIYTQPQPVNNAPVNNQNIVQTNAPVTCPQCSAKCKDSDTFCVSCGTKVK